MSLMRALIVCAACYFGGIWLLVTLLSALPPVPDVGPLLTVVVTFVGLIVLMLFLLPESHRNE